MGDKIEITGLTKLECRCNGVKLPNTTPIGFYAMYSFMTFLDDDDFYELLDKFCDLMSREFRYGRSFIYMPRSMCFELSLPSDVL